MTCTLCNTELKTKIDEYYFECNTCKAIVMNSKYYLSSEEEKARYEAHNNDVTDVRYQNFTSPITNFVLENFTENHKGLDFGSGTGPVISTMLEKNNYNIVQYDPFFAPDKSVLKNKYDYIVSCEVFEHFYNPKLEIENLIDLLNNNGMLLIMTLLYDKEIEFKNWHYRKDPTHVFIYTKETIKYIAKKMKLEIIELSDRLISLKKN